MRRSENKVDVWLKVALLYGSPLLTAAVTVAGWRFGESLFQNRVLLPGLFLLLNAALAAIGSSISGVIGRDSPAARLRGSLDCGAFGIIAHFICVVAIVAGLNATGVF